MSDTAKRNILLLLALLILFVTVIAAALPQLDLQPGQPLPIPNGEVEKPASEVELYVPSISTQNFFKALVALLFILFLPVFVYGLIKKSPWRQIIRYMTLITVSAVVALSVLVLLANMYGLGTQLVLDEEMPAPVNPMATTPLGTPPDWLVWLVFSILALLVGGMGLWLIYTNTQRPAGQNRVAEEAERAIDALKAGVDLKNVIMRCYLQMSVALQQERGIEREEGMTTREFERLLEDMGIPHDPVHDLTRLFEAVRYGRREANAQDEQAAFTCLNAIVQYSRTEGQPR